MLDLAIHITSNLMHMVTMKDMTHASDDSTRLRHP